MSALEHGFWRVTARYSLGHERLLPTGSTNMAGWRKRLFVLMARNAQSAAQCFQLPSNRVVEMGAQIECWSP